MFQRTLTPHLQKMATLMPIIALLGPRQSGKTTLAREAWPNHNYVSLEDIDNRTYARQDPRGFLQKYGNEYGIIIDEFQHAPELPSYIQTHVDEHKKKGYFILTGSQNFLLNQSISQSLAGRVALFSLFPFSLAELKDNGILPDSMEALFFKGGYPRIYADSLLPAQWYRDYIMTYLERDVRALEHIFDLSTFKRFLQLCAGRIGQLLNVSSLASDCGISQATAKGWLSILESSYIIFLLQPHFNNFNKRLVKMPKLYFYDTGLACSLLGIESEDQILRHFARGALMESWVIAQLYIVRCHTNKLARLYFWRDNHGHEVDCIIETADRLTPIEIKSGQTIGTDFFKGLEYWSNLAGSITEQSMLVYGGEENQPRKQGSVVAWRSVNDIWQMIDLVNS